MPDKPRIVIMRGLPGAGKDYNLEILAGEHLSEMVVCSADDFFMEDGEYKFVSWKKGMAHEACKMKCFKAMIRGVDIAISNTNVCKWEYGMYELMADHFGYEVQIFSIYDGGCSDEELHERNAHGVPLASIKAMRQRWES